MAEEELQSIQDDRPFIYLDVRKGLDVRKLGAGQDAAWDREFIQRAAFARLKDIVGERLKQARKATDVFDTAILDRRHGAITIHGTRGSGKTTFVLNAVDRLCEQHRGDLVNLGIIDPTLIGSKENLFLLILNRIQNQVCAHPQWRETEAGRTWEESLRKLAGGLCLLEGVGNDRHLAGDQWEDAHYAMDQGLQKAGDGQSLEANFHAMIAKALEFLGGQAFILALDDIDTNFQQGWTVLETLRRYLTSPRMIVILSGDMDLYAMLVRGKQWQQFPERLLSQDRDMADSFNGMVSHLQGQYLQKILPPAYRIGLAPFNEVAGNVKVEAGSTTTEFVEQFVRAKFRALSGYQGSALSLVLSVILRQPVRTVINILSLIAQVDLSSPPQDENAREKIRILRHGLIGQYSDIFARLHTDSDELYRTDASLFAPFLAELLTRNGLWETAHTILPNLANEDFNLVSLALASMAGACRSPQAFDYMLRICQFRDLAVHFRADVLADQKKMRGAIDYLALNRPGSLLEVSRHALVMLRGQDSSKSKVLRSGTFLTLAGSSRKTEETIRRLYGAKQTNVNGPCSDESPKHIKMFRDTIFAKTHGGTSARWIAEWHNTSDSLLDHIHSETFTGLAGLPFSRILKRNGERQTYASIHNILGALADMVANPSNIDFLLTNAAEIRSYALPGFLDESGDTAEVVENDAAPDSKKKKVADLHDHPMVGELRDWARSMAEVPPLPPYVMAHIWTRFFYGLSAQDDDLGSDAYYLGNLLHRQIALFLNAVYVEEFLHKQEYNKNLRLKNPTTDDQIFLTHLANAEVLPFSRALNRCPLWALYLQPPSIVSEHFDDKGDKNLFSALFPEFDRRAIAVAYDVGGAEPAIFDNLFYLFNSVAVPERKAK